MILHKLEHIFCSLTLFTKHM
uniref:Uncharacterized protein n=1 Tax=Rhizophora mucronata TaxID=61149 RepID=A0A2P2MXF0_RHIMU